MPSGMVEVSLFAPRSKLLQVWEHAMPQKQCAFLTGRLGLCEHDIVARLPVQHAIT